MTIITNKEQNDYFITPEVVNENIKYGVNSPQLRQGIEVLGTNVGGGKYYAGNGVKNTGIGQQTITGVGFTPKMILIQAVFASSEGSMSYGQATSTTNEFCIYGYNNNGGFYSGTSYSSNIIEVQNLTGTTSRAQLASIDTDGFTLNWTLAGVTTNFMYQCFG